MINPSAHITDSELSGNVQVGGGGFINKVQITGNVTIGNYTSVNGPNTDMFSIVHPITIGNFCSIARNTSLQEFTHDYSRCSSYFIRFHFFKDQYGAVYFKGPITIENDVWIGTQYTVLSGVNRGMVRWWLQTV